MATEDIIKRYYEAGSELYALLLDHSASVAAKALEVARMHPEWAVDEVFVREAAELHDIGIGLTNAPDIYCFGEYPYVCHGYLGAKLLREWGLDRHARVCERHTGSGITCEEIVRDGLPLPQRDLLPETLEEKLICFADKFYSKLYPRRVKPVEEIRKSLARYGENAVARWDNMLRLFYG
jgi:uncharacterized protein